VVKGFGWTWNTGGYEYPVFWAIACLVVALEEWKTAFAKHGTERSTKPIPAALSRS
jgi:putative oxidoreductase